MKIEINADELKVGDKWNNRTITAIEPLTNRLLIYFDDDKTRTIDPKTQMLVDRKIERIEASNDPR